MRHQQLAKCSSRQLVFWRRCRQCRVVLTAEGANGSKAWLHCKYHPEAGSKAEASRWEQHARRLLQQLADNSVVATESRILGKGYGASDLLAAARTAGGSRCWVAVEVDGETHFSRPWRGGSKRLRRQQDQEKDERAWQRHQRTVRLHHADTEVWGDALLAAQAYAMMQHLQTFILYTPSYEELGCTSRALRTDGTEVPLNYAQVGCCCSPSTSLHASSRCSRRSSRAPARLASSAHHT